MSIKIVMYEMSRHKRARIVAAAMDEGLKRHGIKTIVRDRFTGVEGDLAVAYGWIHEPIFKKYGHYLYFDLGYWDRKPKGQPKEGMHRLAINSWCPTDYMGRGMPQDRWDAARIPMSALSTGRDILVAAMSEKAARTHGYAFRQWEDAAMLTMRTFTKRRIIYRPKPSKAQPGVPIADALRQASAVVSHHSNVAVEAMIEGVAVYAEKGVGTLVSIPTLRQIDIAQPPDLETRVAFLSDIAYCQWTPQEMRQGDVWEHVSKMVYK
jgi:hypothetical protein